MSLPPLLLLAVACWRASTPEAERVATPPTPWTPDAVPLARLGEAWKLELPPTGRPGLPAARDTFALTEPLTQRTTLPGGAVVWTTPLPVASHLFPTRQAGARTFGYYAPPGVEVRFRGKALRFHREGAEADTWGYSHDRLFIGLTAIDDDPKPEDITIHWPLAASAERSLHLADSGLTPHRFAEREVVIDTKAFHGLYLPAPATATATVKVPKDGVLTLRGTILSPAMRDAGRSDGAELRVDILHAKGETEVVRESLQESFWDDVRADLSEFSGQEVQVRIRTLPGRDGRLDLVFLAEPTLYEPSPTPRRVVLAYLDTVRRDHLGMYGYERPTTPKLDAWAADATRFDAARTVAPWTLPSARAVLTGAQPERWSTSQTLAAQLSAAGFYTDGIVANAFLSPTFDMHRGFSSYEFSHLLPAERVVAHAEDVFEAHPDRDVMVYAQFMEAHLPYVEPSGYRRLFAGTPPAGMPELSKQELDRVTPRTPNFEAIRQHVIDRYDQNLRVLDDEVSQLVEAAGDDGLVVVFADHGEELWDHGGFEHGHTFYDELLRVPLIVRSPHLPAGEVEVPVSLLDVPVTVRDLLGLPAPAVEHGGRSLVPLGYDDAAVERAFDERPVAFGRPLYGSDGWGYTQGDEKVWTRNGDDRAYDIAADPDEAHPRATPPFDPAALSAALGVPVVRAWRLSLAAARVPDGGSVTVTLPRPVQRVWKGYDPRSVADGVEPVVTDTTVTLTAPPGRQLPLTVYLMPTGDPLDARGLTAHVEVGHATADLRVEQRPEKDPGGSTPLAGPFDERLRVRLDLAWVAEPFGRDVTAYAEELAEQLQELGYAD